MVLFLGGCNLEFRDKFDLEPQWIESEKTFIEYFDNGQTYDGYKYSKETLTIDGVDYTYDDNCTVDGDMLIGTFTSETGQTLTGTVDTVTKKITITANKTFIDYFDESVTYNAIYSYDATAKTLTSIGTGAIYTYDGTESGDGITTGEFTSSDKTTTLWAEVTDTSVTPATIVISDIPYLDYFKDGTYGGYTYSYSQIMAALTCVNMSYIFVPDSVTTDGNIMTGTFKYGNDTLEAEVDTSTGEITVTVITKGFEHDNVDYIYNYTTGNIACADTPDESFLQYICYHWQEVNGKYVYFMVDGDHNIYYGARSDVTSVNAAYINGDVNSDIVEVEYGTGIIFINGDVNSDFDIFDSGTIYINGDVSGAVNNTGSGTIYINGNVLGNIFTFGGTVYLSGNTPSYNGTVYQNAADEVEKAMKEYVRVNINNIVGFMDFSGQVQ